MAKRVRLSRRYNKRNFSRTASRVHRKNISRVIYRGGFRF